MQICESRSSDLVRIVAFYCAVALTALVMQMPSAASADELPLHRLEMATAGSHPMLVPGQPREMYATIDLEALDAEVEERPPMNLALVFDRSGSMDGSRIEQARRAATHVVEALDEGDRLALVSYSSDHTVEFDAVVRGGDSRKQMRDTIRGIRAQGGTNLSSGYSAGVDIVETHHDPEAVNRVLLLSDGKANRGITDPDRLQSLSRQAFDDGISTSTIGFGLDYNEQLMTGMAVEGSGNYHFASDGNDLERLIAEETSDMLATVANQIEVLIEPGPTVEITEVLGFTHRYREGRTVIPLSELSSGQTRSVVVRFNAAPRAESSAELMTVRANYRDAVNDRLRYRRQTIRAEMTRDPDEVERNVDRDVLTRVEQVRLARSMDEAMEAYSSGQRERAQSILREESARSRRVQEQYGIESDQLRELDDTYRQMEDTVEEESEDSEAGRQMRMESSSSGFDMMQGR